MATLQHPACERRAKCADAYAHEATQTRRTGGRTDGASHVRCKLATQQSPPDRRAKQRRVECAGGGLRSAAKSCVCKMSRWPRARASDGAGSRPSTAEMMSSRPLMHHTRGALLVLLQAASAVCRSANPSVRPAAGPLRRYRRLAIGTPRSPGAVDWPQPAQLPLRCIRSCAENGLALALARVQCLWFQVVRLDRGSAGAQGAARCRAQPLRRERERRLTRCCGSWAAAALCGPTLAPAAGLRRPCAAFSSTRPCICGASEIPQHAVRQARCR